MWRCEPDPYPSVRHRYPFSPDSRSRRSGCICGDATVCTSIVVAGELRFSARKRGSERLTQRAEALLASMPVLGIVAEVDRRYAEIRWALEVAAASIGPSDLWIAAQAVHADLSLVSANESEL